MAATTIDQLSGGRMILRPRPGPQVVEGRYGMPYAIMDIENVSQSGHTVPVNDVGFSPAHSDQLLQRPGSVGGESWRPELGRSAKIPVTFVDETHFTFQVPAGTVGAMPSCRR
jgi:hypothetical protein